MATKAKTKRPKARAKGKTTRERIDKPPYEVPLMDEIKALPKNGLKMASTFSGCGGSCLGYRMAGWDVAWASEFIPAARETYLANYPDALVDDRDIREVQPSDIMEAIGVSKGELDLFEGSPPCASFSMAGARDKLWGKEKKYSQTTQRADDLFWEYGRLVKGVQPKAFMAENVKGLTTGKAKGYYLDIKEMLQACGYKVECRIVDAQWLGVPQHRERAIFIGVRNDIDKNPIDGFPTKLSYRYAIRDALPHIASLMIRQLYGEDKRVGGNEVSPTVDTKGIGAKDFYHLEANDLEGTSFVGYAIESEWRKLKQGKASKKYFQLVRPDPRKPCPTITQAGGTSPGTAGVTHPNEPRKFTIPELRRICSFPDDFQLLGSFPQQWERCGRAVPPIMARAIARSIARGLFDTEPS
ncbi:MAG: DNA (cytosine-5-)-methyltransferase [Polyangiales bacterium]